MSVRNVSRVVFGVMLLAVTAAVAVSCGPTRDSQENMARNLEQAQEPHLQPARQELLPPPGNDPRLNR